MLATSASYRYASHDRVTYVHALLIACCNGTLHRIITCQGCGALAKLATSFLSALLHPPNARSGHLAAWIDSCTLTLCTCQASWASSCASNDPTRDRRYPASAILLTLQWQWYNVATVNADSYGMMHVLPTCSDSTSHCTLTLHTCQACDDLHERRPARPTIRLVTVGILPLQSCWPYDRSDKR